MTRIDWDTYLLAFAYLAATRSHDPDTQHGAVLADHNHRVIGVGYNGFPRGGDESVYPTRRPDKYAYMVHAEANALYNCALRPCLATLYVTGLPCPQCMLALIQCGVKRVVYGSTPSASIGAVQRGSVDLLARNHQLELVAATAGTERAAATALAAAQALLEVTG